MALERRVGRATSVTTIPINPRVRLATLSTLAEVLAN